MCDLPGKTIATVPGTVAADYPDPARLAPCRSDERRSGMINEALLTMFENGRCEEIYAKWFAEAR